MITFIIGVILGIAIGLCIQIKGKEKTDDSSKILMDSQDELLAEYVLYCNELREYIKIYKDAMEVTLDENIHLKKKLKGM